MESSMPAPERTAIKEVASLWWLWVVAGVAWTIVALVILQFDQASVTTVGVIVGLMFLATGAQQLALMMLVDRMGWLFGIFGVLFLIAGVIALISPENTFAALADVLGFLFLIVGAFWIIQAFAGREENELWWLGLFSGVLMVILAFWTAGQFFIDKAYVLLVFAGIWALMQGVGDITKGFQIRKLGKMI
jgi:MFS family permease